MSERKLASVQKITDITPIEGRDRIVLATVEGWHVIVSKKDFKVGALSKPMSIWASFLAT